MTLTRRTMTVRLLVILTVIVLLLLMLLSSTMEDANDCFFFVDNVGVSCCDIDSILVVVGLIRLIVIIVR